MRVTSKALARILGYDGWTAIGGMCDVGHMGDEWELSFEREVRQE